MSVCGAAEVAPHGLDEFACYRASRVWGFRRAIPIDFVREWFFDFHGDQKHDQRSEAPGLRRVPTARLLFPWGAL